MKKMRSILMSVPSGKLSLILWEGTLREKACGIRGLHTKKPYVIAYGITYHLTEAEARLARQMKGLVM